jgi:hypothetical protein
MVLLFMSEHYRRSSVRSLLGQIHVTVYHFARKDGYISPRQCLLSLPFMSESSEIHHQKMLLRGQIQTRDPSRPPRTAHDILPTLERQRSDLMILFEEYSLNSRDCTRSLSYRWLPRALLLSLDTLHTFCIL